MLSEKMNLFSLSPSKELRVNSRDLISSTQKEWDIVSQLVEYQRCEVCEKKWVVDYFKVEKTPFAFIGCTECVRGIFKRDILPVTFGSRGYISPIYVPYLTRPPEIFVSQHPIKGTCIFVNDSFWAGMGPFLWRFPEMLQIDFHKNKLNKDLRLLGPSLLRDFGCSGGYRESSSPLKKKSKFSSIYVGDLEIYNSSYFTPIMFHPSLVNLVVGRYSLNELKNMILQYCKDSEITETLKDEIASLLKFIKFTFYSPSSPLIPFTMENFIFTFNWEEGTDMEVFEANISQLMEKVVPKKYQSRYSFLLSPKKDTPSK